MTPLTKRAGIQILLTAAAALAMNAMLPGAHAQENESKLAVSKSEAAKPEPEQVQTFFLKNATSTNDLNDTQTSLRNLLSRSRIYGVASQNAITIRGTAEDLQTAQKLLSDIDRAKKVYRLTFTITESDGGRRTSTQHYAMIISGENKSYIKQGNRVPIVTGTGERDGSGSNTQIQYVDVGINIEAAISGVGLHTKIEQTSVADEKSSVGIQDPIVHQNTLDAASTFTPGKPVALGSIDIPGSTRHQDIEVVADLIP